MKLFIFFVAIFSLLSTTFSIYGDEKVDCFDLAGQVIAHGNTDSKELDDFIQSIDPQIQYIDQVTSNGFHYFNSYQYTGVIEGLSQVLGTIEFRYFKESDLLLIADLRVKLKGKKIGTALFVKAVKRFPKTKIIRTTLGIDNYRIFMDEYEKSKNLELALKGTPAYKMRKHLGFKRIDYESVEIDEETQSVSFDILR